MTVLKLIKSELIFAKENGERGSTRMFEIGSRINIDQFTSFMDKRDDMLKLKLNWTYLKYSKSIYKSNIIKWQNIEEQIIF